MSEFHRDLDALTSGAERAYAEAGRPPAMSTHQIGVAARRRRVRRQVASAGAAVALIAALAVAVVAAAPWLGGREVAPAAPGDAVWQVDLGAESYATPLVHAGRVYVGADDGVVRAITSDGTVAWEHDAGSRVRASVTTDGRLLFIAGDDHWVTALRDDGDAASVVWRQRVATGVAPRQDYDVFASAPIVVDDALVLGTTDGEVVSLAASDGTVRWRVRADGMVRTTAAVADGVAYIGTAGGSVVAIEVESGRVLWEYAFAAPVTASPGVGAGVVVAGSRGTEVVGIDAATGAPLWTYSLAPSWAESSATVVDGVAYFGSSAAGVVVAVDVATGEPRWESYVRGWPWSRPVAVDGTVYATTALVEADEPWPWTVYALAADTGAPQWQAATGPALEWSPDGRARGSLAGVAVTDDAIIVVGLDGTVTAFAR